VETSPTGTCFVVTLPPTVPAEAGEMLREG
jgi:hypothetical protein